MNKAKQNNKLTIVSNSTETHTLSTKKCMLKAKITLNKERAKNVLNIFG